MEKPIILKTTKSTVGLSGVVRISPEAQRVVQRLQNKTGLGARYIVSEIIIQAENLIDIECDEEEET